MRYCICKDTSCSNAADSHAAFARAVWRVWRCVVESAFDEFYGGFVLTGTERLLFPSGIAVVSVVEITHKMTINDMALIGAEPYLTLRVLDVITLYARARFGFPVNPTFAYAQTVPEDGQYRFLISPHPGKEQRSLTCEAAQSHKQTPFKLHFPEVSALKFRLMPKNTGLWRQKGFICMV